MRLPGVFLRVRARWQRMGITGLRAFVPEPQTRNRRAGTDIRSAALTKMLRMEVNMNQYCELTDDSMVIHIPRELDHHEAGRLRQEADLMIGACHIRRLIFDFAETEFMDSSGIGVIIGRCRTIGYYGGSACARNLSGRLRKIFLVSGLQELMREDQTGKTERKESGEL